MRIYKKPVEFEWDKGNIGKNKKHKVVDLEAEEVFFDEKKKSYKDIIHSGTEERYILLGKTKKKRLLYLVFTVRKGRVRIISVRDVNIKEVYLYEKAAKSPKIQK